MAVSGFIRSCALGAVADFNNSFSQRLLMGLSLSPAITLAWLTYRESKNHPFFPEGRGQVFIVLTGAIGLFNPFPYARIAAAISGVITSLILLSPPQKK
jgi:hypothetical protein